MKRKVAIVTGSRAEYGHLKPLIRRVEGHPRMQLILYVSGMHLSRTYGKSVDEIRRDGFKIRKKIDIGIKSNNSTKDLALSVGRGVMGFARAFKTDGPDIVVVFGDRIEPFAAAVAATCMNIAVAHINGGDVGFADIDNNLRHAITKLAHLHFTSSCQSRDRVIMLGEDRKRVFNVGALSLDSILMAKRLSKADLCRKYDIPNRPFILVSYHSVTTESSCSGREMLVVMSAVVDSAQKNNMEIVVIYPNANPGAFAIMKVIEEFASKHSNVHAFRNLPHLDYISLMAASSVLVGNSSSGIIEAPSIGIPFVCVGNRQKGRERARNVIDVPPKHGTLVRAIAKSISDENFRARVKERRSPYGDGHASRRIVEVLSSVELGKGLIQKKMAY